MELVEGPTLAERLEAGAFSITESLSTALQIAQALEEAHDKGIIHRDLKPQNVKASGEGKVKVLDFGLAKAMDAGGAAAVAAADLARSPTLMNSPTLTAVHGTQLGVILGTAAYMSPEQAAGKAVDRRADIWAFGVVLWEMLTGRRLFEAESVAETLGAVFRQPIDLDALPASTSPAVRRLVERCLERDPRLRLRDIGEARIALAQAQAAGPADAQLQPRAAATAGWKRALPWVLVALAAAVALTAIGLARTRRPAKTEPRPLIAIGVELPAGFVLAADEAPVLDLSRDGRILVFEANGPSGRQLFRRSLDRTGVEPIEGTAGAVQPFLSPDARWVGFNAGSRMKKVPLAGGAAVDLANVNAYRGATWVEGGWVVYTATYSSGLLKVREAGGNPEPVTELDPERKERTHRWPSAVPGTPWVLFTVGISKSPSFYDDARIDAVRLDTGERKTVYAGAWMARFAPPATLLVQRRSSLLALPFDPVRAEVKGEERTVVEGIGGEPSSGAGYFAAGEGSILAYVPAEALATEKSIALVEPHGGETILPLPPKNYWYPHLSPDGRTLALDIGSGQGTDDDIWLYELAAQRLSRFTFTPASLWPVWSPDGRWIFFGGANGGRDATVFRKRADGVGAEEPYWKGTDIVLPTDWTPDGKALAVTNSTGEIDSYLISNDGKQSRELVAAPGTQWGVSFSPDGRFLAYTSTETGVEEVFVSSYPEGTGKWQVSVDGGQQPLFSRDGRQLYFMQSDALWAVDVDTRDGFRVGTPQEILRGPYILRTAPFRNYDVGADGRFVLVRRRTDVTAPRQLELLVGWDALPGQRANP